MNDIRAAEIFADFPPVVTERLKLRKIKIEDADDMFEYASDERLTEYLSWEPHKTIKFTKNYVRYLQKQYKNLEYFDWAITLKENGKMIGTCGFTSFYPEHSRAEIGYVVSCDFQGRGIATEAAKAVATFAFEQLDINRLEAKFIVGNHPSEAVMKKIGMKKEGIMRDYLFVKGDYRDICLYAMTAQDYFAEKYNISAED